MILPTVKDNMSSESFNEALKKVFFKLLKRKSPIVDDTCLQKLLDKLSIFVSDAEGVESCGAAEFLKSMKDDPSIGDATLIFGTQVAGRLSQKEEIFVHFEELFLGFYAKIFETSFWQESLSLKTATFHSLKQTIKHPPGFLGIIRHFPDLTKETFNAIREESSIFLTKESSNLIASLIVQSVHIQSSDFRHSLLNKCWECICSPGSTEHFANHNPFLEPVFLLLCEADTNCKVVLSWLAKQENVLEIIVLIIINTKSSELWFQAIDVYLDLLYRERIVTDPEDKMADILNKLNKKEHLKKLQTFIVKFLKRHSNEEPKESLIKLFCQPLSDVKEYIDDKSCELPLVPKTKDLEFSSMECEKIISHIIHCWMDIMETNIIKKDCVATAIRSSSRLLLHIIGILAAKEKIQTSRHYLFLKTLAKSNKLLVKILQYFCKLADCSQEECRLEMDCVVKLLYSSLLIIEDVEQTSSVVSHAFECIFCYLNILLSHVSEENSTETPTCDKDDSDCDMNPQINLSDYTDINADNIPTIAASVVTCCLCHPQWEMRDTTVEFLAKIFKSCAVSPRLLSWVKKHKLHNSAYSSFSDGESYVRATAITTMTSCLQSDALWSDFLSASKKSLDDILQDFIQVLQTDTEAFPRRAAVKFLLETHKKDLLNPSQKALVYKSIVNVLESDLDWEVKISAVNLWENVISAKVVSEISCPAYAIGLPAFASSKCQACKICTNLKKFQALSKIGCTNSLLIALKDCDHGVRERAGQVLVKLLYSDQEDKDFILESSCQKMEAAKTGEDLFNCCMGSCCKDQTRDSSKHEGSAFLKRLSELNFKESLKESEINYCDLYTQNPLSLVEDILADCEENEDDDKIVDCY